MENDFVRWLRTRLPSSETLKLGAGDDAAIVDCTDAPSVVTSDLLCDGVHFKLGEHSAQRIGRKALAVNLSDLAAMAAKPITAIVSILVPELGGRTIAEELMSGIVDLAEEFEISIAGGDTNSWSGSLVVSVTAIGSVQGRPLLRSGAKVGDSILVTGSLGGSILGHHLDFTPRVHESLRLNSSYQLHSGMDVSDGLLVDLSRLISESGVGAELNLDWIPIAAAAEKLTQASGLKPIEHALSDGEDFELLITAPPESAEKMLSDQPLSIPITKVGEIVDEPGLWRIDGSQRTPLPVTGYQHKMSE